MIGAPLTGNAFHVVNEGFQLFRRKKRRSFFSVRKGIEGAAVSSHQLRKGGADDVRADLLFESAQYGVAFERAALNDYVFAEVFSVRTTDHFI